MEEERKPVSRSRSYTASSLLLLFFWCFREPCVKAEVLSLISVGVVKARGVKKLWSTSCILSSDSLNFSYSHHLRVALEEAFLVTVSLFVLTSRSVWHYPLGHCTTHSLSRASRSPAGVAQGPPLARDIPPLLSALSGSSLHHISHYRSLLFTVLSCALG